MTSISDANEPADGGFRTVLNMLIEPATAFASLRERPSWLLPVLLVAGSTGLVMLWYFSILDIPWFMENLLYQGGAEPTEEEVEAFRARNGKRAAHGVHNFGLSRRDFRPTF